MAGTTISSSVTVGVKLTAASQNPVIITGSGTIDVAGLYASAIYAPFGIPATITNAGLLEAPNGYGIRMVSGGSVTNGSKANTTAEITGGVDGVKLGIFGAGTVDNFATIASTGTSQGVGVLALGSANVVNGSAVDTTALISGYFDGVEIMHAGATVANFGTITATGTSTTLGSSSFGVYLRGGGVVTNGSAADTKAAITGTDYSIKIDHAPGTVVNFGTIKTAGPLGRGVTLDDGGSVTNNSAGYIGASDLTGVYIAGPVSSSVTNLGTIKAGRSGVNIEPGGTVTNGSATDKTASITGARFGVYIAGLLPSAVNNFGTIAATGTFSAVELYLGGNVVNGSAADTTALITGFHGISAGGPATIVNFGTISSATSNNSAIHLNAGGVIINGSTADKRASILSATVHNAIYVLSGLVTVTNFGTISGGGNVIDFTNSATATVVNSGTIASTSGTAGNAIQFGSGAERLVVDPGAVFVGKVIGGSGANTMELASAASSGTIGGLGTQFVDFTQVTIDVNASWTLSGSIAGGVTLLGGASLTNSAGGVINDASGAAVYSGSTSTTVSVINAGVLINSGTTQAAVALHDGGHVSNAMIGTITASSGTGVYISGAAGTLINAGRIAGTKYAGVQLYSGGSVTNAASGSITGAHGVQVYGGVGTVVNNGSIAGMGTDAGGVELNSSGGSVTNAASASITGRGVGVGVVGGAGTVVNAGSIAATGTSNYVGVGLLSGGSVTNAASGSITGAGGLTINGSITGSGGVLIAGGTGIVVNNGSIAGTGTGASGVKLNSGGSVTNAAGASISGGSFGIAIYGSAGIVVNDGSIASAATNEAGVLLHAGGSVVNDGNITSSGFGVALTSAGSVTNGTSGSITGDGGVAITGGGGTVVNDGIITGTGSLEFGVDLNSVGSVANAAFASIKGGLFGVEMSVGGTLKNAGSISGGTAVALGGTGSNLLVLDPGFGFSGKVTGSTSASNTLELASAASAGTIGGLGTTFTGFGSTVVDTSAHWTLTGANAVATLSNNGTLSIGGTLDVTTAVAPTSSGLFLLANTATLEVAADTGAGTRMQFLNPAELIVDTAAHFGSHVGTTAYTGPLIESFAAGDSILLKNVLAAGSVLNYSTASGLLQVSGGGTAALLFQNSSLGAGSFQLAADPSGHALITLVSGGGSS